jgi:hypothetical protein
MRIMEIADILPRYLTLALVLIPYKSVKAELADGKFTFKTLFSNSIFFTLIVSLLSTYVLWIFISIVSLDAWHIVTSVRPSLPPFPPHPLTKTKVVPVLPPLPNLRQRNQRLRILQRPRRNLGHARRGQSVRPGLHQDHVRRQRRRRHLLAGPRRALRRLACEDRRARPAGRGEEAEEGGAG